MARIVRFVLTVVVVAVVISGGAALAWNKGGSDRPGKGCGDKNHVHYKESSCGHGGDHDHGPPSRHHH